MKDSKIYGTTFLNPHPLLVKLIYTHPPLSQRIAAIEEKEKTFNFQFNDNTDRLQYNTARTNDGGELVGGLTGRQKKLADEFQKAERSGIGSILAIYRREMDSWGNDCQKLVDLLTAMEARLDSPFSVRVDDSIYWALADTIKVFAGTHLNDQDYRMFREYTGLQDI